MDLSTVMEMDSIQTYSHLLCFSPVKHSVGYYSLRRAVLNNVTPNAAPAVKASIAAGAAANNGNILSLLSVSLHKSLPAIFSVIGVL